MKGRIIILTVCWILLLSGCYIKSTSVSEEPQKEAGSVISDFEEDEIVNKNISQVEKEQGELQRENKSDILIIEPAFRSEPVTIEEEPVTTYTGNLEDNEEDVYEFMAPRDGIYGFTTSEIRADSTVTVHVYDKFDNELVRDRSGTGSSELKKDEDYRVTIENSGDETGYQLDVGVPKDNLDISRISEINDQIQYYDQKNRYLITAPITGTYRFDITEVNANNTFEIHLYDKLKNYMPGQLW